MKIFKFGGASVNSIERIKNIPAILNRYAGEKLLVVISAMGKTTNALEKVAEHFFKNDQEVALSLFDDVKQQYTTIITNLLPENNGLALSDLNNVFTEVEWLLHDKPVKDYDYYYDQIVCSGELMSTLIVSAYLNSIDKQNCWIDVRDIFRTDNNFRDASIDWEFTQNKVDELIKPLLQTQNIIITQGFIASTDQNESTTLGREGSDYSAAIFANMLNAEKLTIWKDVKGVMNADPRLFPEAKIIKTLSFDEVIEMAYYGAQVIHPKTIKPLQNKNIALHVKCFLDPDLPGTIIAGSGESHLPPVIVVKQQQVLLMLHSKDFSFVGEQYVSELYKYFAEVKIKPNLIQTGAVSILCCVDENESKVEKLALKASGLFDVGVEKGLTLLTVRHYNNSIVDELAKDKIILLEQKTPETIQLLYKAN
ncbi:MAG: aspartate kinase [Ginsengibacter sp.]